MINNYYDYFMFKNLNNTFKKVNDCFYSLITEMGLEIDLSKKDQQKIYTHYFIKTLCDELDISNNKKIIYYINLIDICSIHKKIIKKIVKIFGFRIYTHYYSLEQFLSKLKSNDCEIVDDFDTFLNKQSKPSSFRKIKRHLDKEGMTYLSDSYFQEIANKIAIMC